MQVCAGLEWAEEEIGDDLLCFAAHFVSDVSGRGWGEEDEEKGQTHFHSCKSMSFGGSAGVHGGCGGVKAGDGEGP